MAGEEDQDEQQQEQEQPMVVTALGSLLQRVSKSNDITNLNRRNHQNPAATAGVSAFDGLTRPIISVKSYLQRIFTYADCSHSCYVVAYIYLDRFVRRHPFLPIDSFNVHRLLITSVLVSAKFMDDVFYNNAYYAKVGGISTVEINMLEVDFLFGLGFNLNVNPVTFSNYCSSLEREILIQSLIPERSRSFVRSLSMSPNCCFVDEEEEDISSDQKIQNQVDVL